MQLFEQRLSEDLLKWYLKSNSAPLYFVADCRSSHLKLADVTDMSSGDASIFPEYIIPALKRYSSDAEVFVRVTWANCIATIAEAALQFLEMAQVGSEVLVHSIEHPLTSNCD